MRQDITLEETDKEIPLAIYLQYNMFVQACRLTNIFTKFSKSIVAVHSNNVTGLTSTKSVRDET